MALVKDSTKWTKRFYKQSFEIKRAGVSVLLHTLLLNPEDNQVDEPARVNITQTLGGAYVTDFGQGLFGVTIAGTTGYKKRANTEGYITDGYEEFKNLRNKLYRNYIAENDPRLSMYWYDWENEDYYEIQPQNFRIMRNKAEPLLFRYEFKFTCIQTLKGVKRKIPDKLYDPRPDIIGRRFGTSTSAISEFLDMIK